MQKRVVSDKIKQSIIDKFVAILLLMIYCFHFDIPNFFTNFTTQLMLYWYFNHSKFATRTRIEAVAGAKNSN